MVSVTQLAVSLFCIPAHAVATRRQGPRVRYLASRQAALAGWVWCFPGTVPLATQPGEIRTVGRGRLSPLSQFTSVISDQLASVGSAMVIVQLLRRAEKLQCL